MHLVRQCAYKKLRVLSSLGHPFDGNGLQYMVPKLVIFNRLEKT